MDSKNTSKNSIIKDVLVLLVSSIIIVALDQAVKALVVAHMAVGESIPLLDGVFHITYVRNAGAAWSSFSGKTFFLLAVTVIILVLLVGLYFKVCKVGGYKDIKLLSIFVFGGAIGNMIDRVRLGYVVDMFDFCLINFPVFNVADIFVTCSMIVLIFLVIFKYKDEDFDLLFGKSNTSKNED